MILKNCSHRLQIELCSEIKDSEIFVIKSLNHCRLLNLALGEIDVEFAMGVYMPFNVHAHEGSKLYKTWIDAAERTRIAWRHRCGQRSFEPLDRSFIGEFVDFGRVDARVNGTRHQRHAAWLRRVPRLHHDCDRCEHSDARLADADNVSARPHQLQKIYQVLNVFIEAKSAGH